MTITDKELNALKDGIAHSLNDWDVHDDAMQGIIGRVEEHILHIKNNRHPVSGELVDDTKVNYKINGTIP